jgi:hypothetical protein
MKVTLQQLFAAHPAFEILGMQFFALDKIIPARNLFEQINTHYAAIAQKQEELLSFYGTKNDEGKWIVADDKKPFYEKELNEYLSDEVELDWEPANIDDLGDIRMPMAAFELLEFLFVPEELPVK